MSTIIVIIVCGAASLWAVYLLTVASLSFARSLPQPAEEPALSTANEAPPDESEAEAASRRRHKADRLVDMAVDQMALGKHEDAAVSWRLAVELRDIADDADRGLATLDKRLTELNEAAKKLQGEAYQDKLEGYDLISKKKSKQARALEKTATNIRRTGVVPDWFPPTDKPTEPEPKDDAANVAAAVEQDVFQAHGFADAAEFQHAWWRASNHRRTCEQLQTDFEVLALEQHCRGDPGMVEAYEQDADRWGHSAFRAHSWLGLHIPLRERQQQCD